MSDETTWDIPHTQVNLSEIILTHYVAEIKPLTNNDRPREILFKSTFYFCNKNIFNNK